MDAKYELSAKRLERSVLETELDEEELWEYDKYQRLNRQIAALERAVDDGEAEIESTRLESVVIRPGE